MVATTDQKARLFDLSATMLELVRNGMRDADQVCAVLQIIKDRPDFSARFGLSDRPLEPWFGITTVSLSLDYTESIESLWKAGKYEWGDYLCGPLIFPSEEGKSGETAAYLLHFDREISGEFALREMEAYGFRPGSPFELLCLGAQHPDLQVQFPIAALGYLRWLRGHRDAVVFTTDEDAQNGRGVDTHWFEASWHRGVHFLAFKK